MYLRLLQPPKISFFLFGPRGVGKTTWLKTHFKKCPFFNLLDSKLYYDFSANPNLLESKIGPLAKQSWVVIDEIQKVPMLLNEVHRLIEEKNLRFVLTGSSARKLRRDGPNLLGGRAVTRTLAPFSFKELGNKFKLQPVLEYGLLPLVILKSKNARDILSAYVHTYLKEEIREEGLVRKVEPFVRFLKVAGLMNGEQLNIENIARDARVPRNTAETYFSILEDTLLGTKLPAYRPRAKVKEQSHPKFYWADAGIARAAAGLVYDQVDSLWLGRALETLVYHELKIHNAIANKNRSIAFYKNQDRMEIDFVIETKKAYQEKKSHLVCVEVKHSKKWDRKWEKPMRSLKATGEVIIDKMFGIYQGHEKLYFDGLQVLPVLEFLKLLHQGNVF